MLVHSPHALAASQQRQLVCRLVLPYQKTTAGLPLYHAGCFKLEFLLRHVNVSYHHWIGRGRDDVQATKQRNLSLNVLLPIPKCSSRLSYLGVSTGFKLGVTKKVETCLFWLLTLTSALSMLLPS